MQRALQLLLFCERGEKRAIRVITSREIAARRFTCDKEERKFFSAIVLSQGVAIRVIKRKGAALYLLVRHG